MRMMIAEYLRVIVGYSMMKSVEEKLKGYFRLRFQEHVMENFDLGKVMGGELGGYTGRIETLLLDEFGSKFITGKYETLPPYRDTPNRTRYEHRVYKEMEGFEGEKADKIRELMDKFEGMEVTDQMWEAGYGKEIEEKLRPLVYKKLGPYRVRDREGVTSNILMKSNMIQFYRNENNEQGIWKDIEGDVLRFIGNSMQEVFKDVKKHVAAVVKTETSLESLEPGYKEEGEVIPSRERLDPAMVRNENFDVDEVSKWVEVHFSPMERLVYFNSLLEIGDAGRLSNEALSLEIERRFGRKVESQKAIPKLQKELMNRVYDKFFRGSGLKRKKELEEFEKEQSGGGGK